ncbi:nucleoid-associated protein [Alistipes timonensis]|uniref:nucleoid-associated protein n=1 Tax=Alistipes timonensis TaxID=1465754 RepID=UPI00242F81A0|nr:nucleoid-associated protein [Alistipes timonensis]
MIQNAIIKNIYCHYVGNRTTEEGIALSSKELNPSDKIMEKLLTFFLIPLKMDYLNVFYHEADLNLNEVYTYASKIFENPKTLGEQSVNLAKHLYEHSNHPKIKGGEFYVVYFKECVIDGKAVDAIGLFKSENKDTFLKVYPSDDGFEIESQQGVNINKLDKGCLIFNTEKENGYVVAVVDNTNKGAEAHYWIDDFLHIRQRKDEYYNTQNIISMTKNFVTKALPQEFEISKADQADLTNRTLNFFKEKDTFDIDEFTNEVIGQPEVIDSFNKYKNEYQKEEDIEIADSFTISDTAVKKQARILKSIIKLDKNFHIYIHGNNQYIKKGYDETTGMYFYQLFFKEEL